MIQKLYKIFKFLASLKFAVIVILSIAVISAVGTIYEARFDAQVAQKLVYQSIYMYIALGALCVSLIFVMIDRWPWKPHHAGFVLAHIGILILLTGALMTQLQGIDGSLQLRIGGENRYIVLPDTEVSVYASFEGDRFTQLSRQPVDFIRRSPADSPYTIDLSGQPLVIDDYYHFALRKEEVSASDDPTDGPAVRFQLQNERVNVSHWLVLPRGKDKEEMDLGPAKVIVTHNANYKPANDNQIVLVPQDELVQVFVYSKKDRPIKRATLRAGDTLATGWMGLELRVLKVLKRAVTKIEFIKKDKGTELTTSAIRLYWQGKPYWLGINSFLRLFHNDKVFVVTFANKRLDLGFDVFLKNFAMGRYQGTNRASSYASHVQIKDGPDTVISMNNPLKYRGYTLYQASFSSDERGQPVESILSVNKDPGRPVKYFGSFLIVLGCIVLFYFKKILVRKKGSA